MTKTSIALYENPLVSNQFLADLSAAMRGWKQRVTDLGGYDNASGDYWTGKGDKQSTANQAWDMFMHGLGRRVVASINDVTVWEGRIQQMRLRTQGVELTRSLDTLANMVKLIYFQMGKNILVNGSAEVAGTYGLESGPGYAGLDGSTNVYRRAGPAYWTADGSNSFFLDLGGGWGHGIVLSCSENCVSGGKYQFRFVVNITEIGESSEGAPALFVEIRNGGSSGTILYQWSTNEPGFHTLVTEFTCPISTGSTVVQTKGNSNMELYLDGVVLFENGTRKETQIYSDQDSIDAYGPARMEYLKGAMDPTQAAAEAQLLLAEYAWPRTECVGLATDEGLTIECAGFIHSLAVDYATTGGLAAASDHIVALVAQSTLLTTGIIKTNTLNVYIEEAENVLLWDALKQAIQAGDASGNRWVGGCYADRKFNYNAADTTPRYIRKNGQWCHLGGAPVDPALLHPGMVRWDDAPESPYSGRDPRIGYIASVEYDRDSDSVTVSEAAPERNRFGRKDSVSDALATATIVSARASYAVVGTAGTHQLTGSEHYESGLTPGDVLTALSATSFGFETPSAGHDAVTLDATTHADDVLGLTGQMLTLDAQSPNTVLAGPASGAAAAPAFRALVAGDLPAGAAGVPTFLFGDGSDSDVTISADTSTDILKHYNNLTVDAGFVFTIESRLPIYVKDTLTINGTIRSPYADAEAGGNNTGATGGYGGAGEPYGAAGGNAGSNGGDGTGPQTDFDQAALTEPQSGGNGGDGAVGTGGGGSDGADSDWYYPGNYTSATIGQRHLNTVTVDSLLSVSNALPGGAGGGGGGVAITGAGGGGGGGTGYSRQAYLSIIARHIVWGAAGAIESKGGNGGDGGNSDGDGGGGGGGAGGNGGIVILCYEDETGTRNVDVSGGDGGTGGTSVSADPGANGPDGYDGVVIDLPA